MNLVENGLVDAEGQGEGKINGEVTSTYILSCVKQIDGGKLLRNIGSLARHSVMTQRGGMRGGEGGSRRRDFIYVYN